ncbi:MAG: hypothetical protein ACLT38_04395 [Akkermansia sp.]
MRIRRMGMPVMRGFPQWSAYAGRPDLYNSRCSTPPGSSSPQKPRAFSWVRAWKKLVLQRTRHARHPWFWDDAHIHQSQPPHTST